MTKVRETISVRGLEHTVQVDVEIEAEAHDGEMAMEWVEDIYAAVRDEVERKKQEGEDAQ